MNIIINWLKKNIEINKIKIFYLYVIKKRKKEIFFETMEKQHAINKNNKVKTIVTIKYI
jgi:hypothetical protein